MNLEDANCQPGKLVKMFDIQKLKTKEANRIGQRKFREKKK